MKPVLKLRNPAAPALGWVGSLVLIATAVGGIASSRSVVLAIYLLVLLTPGVYLLVRFARARVVIYPTHVLVVGTSGYAPFGRRAIPIEEIADVEIPKIVGRFQPAALVLASGERLVCFGFQASRSVTSTPEFERKVERVSGLLRDLRNARIATGSASRSELP